MSRARLLVLAAPLWGACGDNDHDVLDRLHSLGDVEVHERHPTDGEPNARYFDLEFAEPLDHTDPSRGEIALYAELIHVDDSAPTVLYTSGYGATFSSHRGELATVLGGNQLKVAYRYFDQDVPNPDWSYLTVEQAAGDFHDVVTRMRPLEGGAWLHAGGSKGGMTALFSRFLYPDDVDGVVAYVAPLMDANPDEHFATVLDSMGDDACRTALRAAERAIATRRDAMATRASAAGDSYTVLGVDYAAQTAIIELEWSFWQYRGEPACGAIPAATADDDTLYQFLDQTSPVSGYADLAVVDTDQPFTWQVMTQLGYPRLDYSRIADLVTVDYQDLSPQLPPGVTVPTLDPTLSNTVRTWADSTATRLMLIYGQWDPWSAGGAVDVAPGNDSFRYVVAGASHLTADLTNLDPTSRAEASATLKRWTGVAPKFTAARAGVGPGGDDLRDPAPRTRTWLP